MKNRNIKVLGLNCAGILNKLESFENLLLKKEPSIFCLQETKVKRQNQIKTESCKKFTIYELLRKKSNGGGLALGVHHDLQPAWVDQGDDEVEVIVVEVWVNDFPIRIVNGYGPQLSDSIERKQNFWAFIEKQVENAIVAGAGLIIQMDGNSHLGSKIIEGDLNVQNANGKLMCEFLQRNPHLTLINSLPLCEGKITRMRKTTKTIEKSILDVFITCDKILPYSTNMVVDEKRENALTNFKAVKHLGRIIESDHNAVFLNLSLTFPKLVNERITVYQFKNKKSQEMFKTLTTETAEFTNCFSDFKTHIQKYHGNSEVPKCESCEIIFEKDTNLKVHNENVHSNERCVKCVYCHFIAEDKHAMKQHLEKQHSSGKPIKCEICNITFESSFEKQAISWRNILENYFKKCFKKVRITNKVKGKTQELNVLMERRRKLIRKDILNDEEERELKSLEESIASECEEINKKKVMDNFKELENNGDVNYQGIWKIKQKYFPKIKPTLPAGKRNMKQQLITNPAELKKLYLETFKHRLRHRPVQPGFESLLNHQKELFDLRIELAKEDKSEPWGMADLEDAIRSLKTGKCRDPEGIIREIFMKDSMGEDLKQSLLILCNKIKETREIPQFIQKTNICAIYKGRGDVLSLESDRGIFLITIFRTILMKMVYKNKYSIIDQSMSDSNIGARKQKNIRNHIFVVNSVLHDVLKNKSKKPIDLMVLDYKQMFDSECLYECMNDLYEAGVKDDLLPLIYEANRTSYVAVQTPHGLSKRETFEDLVMQGDVISPLISSLQVDTMGKECLEEKKHLFYFKDIVPVPPLGMVDDLLTISECGYKAKLMNEFINFKTGTKRLQFGTSKCIKMHIGKSNSEILCQDLYVGEWKNEVIEDPQKGGYKMNEFFSGNVKMEDRKEQKYLGDLLSSDGTHTKNVQDRRNKGYGVIKQIVQILEATYFGKYHFEVAMVLRKSLFLSSLLLNSEAWVNYTEKDIRILEQCDENLLSSILECESNSSNALKYLELGVIPIRFEIMKRKLLFLQYILKQGKDTMIYKILRAIEENPIKNDFVNKCKKYLELLKINITLDKIKNMTKLQLKKILKEKIQNEAFMYLRNQQAKQEKIKDIQYKELKMQDYLADGDRKISVSKVIYRARGMSLDIKMHRRWKYEDIKCVGCQEKSETGEEILQCDKLGLNENQAQYSWFFSSLVSKQRAAGKVMVEKLKKRKRIREEIT